MDTKTLGATIAELRKQKGLTQLELADMMGVTDKAVSKWERDISCPDISALPRLAEIFGVTVDELLRAKTGVKKKKTPNEQLDKIIYGALSGVALAQGIAVVVGTELNAISPDSVIRCLGIGMISLGLLAMISLKKS